MEVLKESERTKMILEMRREGMSLAKIGEKFGITRQRVHTIVHDYEELMKANDDPLFQKLQEVCDTEINAMRLYNTLRRCGVRSLDDLDKKSMADLCRIRNIGDKAVSWLMEIKGC